MTKKQKRVTFIIILMVSCFLAAGFVLNALKDSVAFFYGPSDVIAHQTNKPELVKIGKVFRLGGMVKEGSVQQSTESPDISFTITDHQNDMQVTYRGVLPDLFREGQGIIAIGRLKTSDLFIADEVLAKHDENYMPPEVSDALERAHENAPAYQEQKQEDQDPKTDTKTESAK